MATWATTVTVTSPFVSITGMGGSQSTFTCTVNGDCLRVYMNPFTIQQAGNFGGFSIYAPMTPTTNGVGVHAGEIVGAHFDDMEIGGFYGTGGIVTGYNVTNTPACTVAPSVVITGIGGGLGASAVAPVVNGTVPYINGITGGSGYTSGATVSFTGGICSIYPTATATVTVGSDFWLDNAHAGTPGVGTWTERNLFTKIHLQGSTIPLRITREQGTNSFGYNRMLDVRINPVGPATTSMMSIENSSYVYDGTYRFTINNAGSGDSIFTLKDTAQWVYNEFHIFGEDNGTEKYLWNICSTCLVSYSTTGTNLGNPAVLSGAVFQTVNSTSDGDIVVATGGILNGIFTVNFIGPNRDQSLVMSVVANRYDSASYSLSVLSNYAYLGSISITNPRVVLDSDSNPQLVVTLGNRGTGGGTSINASASSYTTNHRPVLLPGSAVGTKIIPSTYGIIRPQIVYSKYGIVLAACASGTVGGEAVVSDATSLTPGTVYVPTAPSPGSNTGRVQCTLTGKTYAWQTM